MRIIHTTGVFLDPIHQKGNTSEDCWFSRPSTIIAPTCYSSQLPSSIRGHTLERSSSITNACTFSATGMSGTQHSRCLDSVVIPVVTCADTGRNYLYY